MSKQNVAVLVSGGGTNLQALIDAQSRGEFKSARLSIVISNKSSAFALERAKKAGIKTEFIASKDEESLLKCLKDNDIDLLVLAGYLAILSDNVIKAYRDRIINVHPSLIPSFCGKGYYGLKVHEEALKYGVKVSGATVHYVNEITDGGKIIFQKAVEVKDGDSPKDLQERIMKEAEWILLPRATEYVCEQILKAKEDK